MRDVSLLEPAVFEGTPCVRVQGTLTGGGGDTVEIWIGRDDFLIRRIAFTPPPGVLDGKLLGSEEIRRNIKVDEVIADDTFEFTPPPESREGRTAP